MLYLASYINFRTKVMVHTVNTAQHRNTLKIRKEITLYI